MWVADSEDRKIYAYKMSDRSRDPGKDFPTLNSKGGNHKPKGIWSDGVNMWVADSRDVELYSYYMESKAAGPFTFGSLARAGNDAPYGIWANSVNNTPGVMWAADSVDGKIYAYKNLGRGRDPEGRSHQQEYDVEGLDGSGHRGIWSDGETMWVVDSANVKVAAYRMPSHRSAANKFSAAVGKLTATTATATVRFENTPESPRTVFLRYRPLAAPAAWSTPQSATVSAASGDIAMTGLTRDTRYLAQVSLDENFSVNLRYEVFTTPVLASVKSVSLSDPAQTYGIGDIINATVTFSEAVTVDTSGGAPQLAIDVGGTDKYADYVSGSNSAALTFSYTVVEGDEDTDGIAVGPDKLRLNGGTIKDGVNNDVPLAHSALAAQADHKVDGVKPVAPAVTATAGAAQVTLGWDSLAADTTIAKFQYRHKESAASEYGEWTDVENSDHSTVEAVVKNLTIGIEYSFQVRAVDRVGNEGAAAATVVVVEDHRNLEAPGNFSATPVGKRRIDLSWDAPTVPNGGNAIAKYTILWSDDDWTTSNTFEIEKDSASNAPIPTSHSDTGLPPNTTRQYQISAYNGEHGNPSETVTATTDAGPTFDDRSATEHRIPLMAPVGSRTSDVAVAATDPDGDEITYSLSGAGHEHFSIDENGVVKTAKSLLGAEGRARYELTVAVRDNLAAVGATAEDIDDAKSLNIVVEDALPIFRNYIVLDTATGIVTHAVTEHHDEHDDARIELYDVWEISDQPITWRLQGTDAEKFKIESDAVTGLPTGPDGNTRFHMPGLGYLHQAALSFVAPPDHEAPTDADGDNVYLVTVVASNPRGEETLDVTVIIDNSDEPGLVTISGDFAEGNELTARLTDPDGGVNGAQWSWSAMVNGQWTRIENADSDSYTLTAGDVDKRLRVTVAYRDLQGIGKHAEAEIEKPAQVVNAPAMLGVPAGEDGYQAGEYIVVGVTFDRGINVTGTPRLELTVGEAQRWAQYSHRRADGAQLVFAYETREDDQDADGVSAPADALELNGGSIVDNDGHAAMLHHPAMPNQAGHKVDGSAG